MLFLSGSGEGAEAVVGAASERYQSVLSHMGVFELKVPRPRLLAELWHAYFRSRVWKRGFLLLDLIPGRR